MSYISFRPTLAVVQYMPTGDVMNEGEVVEVANSDDIYRTRSTTYTKKLLSSIPRVAPRIARTMTHDV